MYMFISSYAIKCFEISFDTVGTDVPPGVDPTQLHPPIKLLHIVSQWLESSPSYLYTTSPLGRNITELPLMHSHDLTTTVQASSHISRSPLAGIIQWCILAPLSSKLEPQNDIEARRNSELQNKSGVEVTVETNNVKVSVHEQVKNDDPDSLFAALHASLLSVVISRSSATQGSCVALSRDDVAVIVAALLGIEQHTQSMWRKFVKSRMDECVERLAQFMQIGLSNGMVNLSPGVCVCVCVRACYDNSCNSSV